MPEPYDYTSAFANLQSPGASFLQGIQGGATVQQIQLDRQQKEIAFQQAQQQRQDLAVLSQNPTPQAISALMIKYPGLSEQLKRASDVTSSAQQQGRLNSAGQVYSALNAGDQDTALRLLGDQAKAARNSNMEQDARAAETMAQLIQKNPGFAKTTIGMRLAAAVGPEKFADTFAKLGDQERAQQLAPSTLAKSVANASEAQSDAVKAAADATVANATIQQQIAKPASDLLTAEQQRRLNEFDAQIKAANSETDRGRLTLEREKFVAEQGLKQQDIGAGAQAQIDSAQMALDNIKSLRNNPILKDTTSNSFTGIGTVLGQMLGNVPGTENKDFRGQLESLKSQIFLPAVQQVKGMGALSNAEGEKLTASVAALDANMSPTAFKNALGVVEKYMTKGLQKGLASKNVPTQGGGFVVNHPTFGVVKEGDINRLLKQHPGATREQIMTWLSQTGAK